MILKLALFFLGFMVMAAANSACNNADMTGEWVITKQGFYGGHSLCKIKFVNNKAKGATKNCKYIDESGSTTSFGFKGSTRFTVASNCKVTVKAVNTLGATLKGTAYLSRDGNNMVGQVANQNGVPMTLNGVKLQ